MARRFTNGTTDEISFGSFSALEGVGAATISVWVRRRASTTFSHIVCKTASGPDGITLLHGGYGFGDDGIYASVSLAGTEGDLYINNVCTLDTWVHVALRFDGSATGNDRLHLYINGTQQSVTRASTTYPATIGGSGANLRVGGTDHEADVRPSDDIAWLGVWTSALTDAQIASLAQGLNPARLGPTLFAPLFGSSSEPDLAGGLSGTVTGTSVVDGPRVGWGALIGIPQYSLTPIELSTSLSTNVSTSNTLSTTIKLASSFNSAVAATAALTTAISLASSFNSAVASTAALTTAISLASSFNTSVASTAALTTAISLASSFNSAVTLAASLTSPIELGSSLVVEISSVNALTTLINLNSSLTTSVTTTAALTLAIELASLFTASVSLNASINMSAGNDTLLPFEGGGLVPFTGAVSLQTLPMSFISP